jgi:hypothetical protein
MPASCLKALCPMALLCAGVLVAFACAPAGAMATLEFESDSYPPTVRAEAAKGVVWLETEAGRVDCATSFDELMGAREERLRLSLTFSSCSAFGIAEATVKSEGCELVLLPTEVVAKDEYAAHADLSCPAGKALEVTAGNCEVEFKSQEGLTTVGLANDLVASPDEMEFRPLMSGLQYTVAKDGAGCPFNGTGARFGGSFASSESLTMTGTGSGSGIRLVGTESSSPTPNFEASSYPLVTGTPFKSNKGAFKLELEAGTVECLLNGFTDGTLNEKSPELSFSRFGGNCTAFGLGAATFNSEECRYEFHLKSKTAEDQFNSYLSLVCPAGKSIKITAGTCSAEVKSQWMLNSAKFVNDTATTELTGTMAVSGLSYLVTQDGIGCPFAGTGWITSGKISSSEPLAFLALGAS